MNNDWKWRKSSCFQVFNTKSRFKLQTLRQLVLHGWAGGAPARLLHPSHNVYQKQKKISLDFKRWNTIQRLNTSKVLEIGCWNPDSKTGRTKPKTEISLIWTIRLCMLAKRVGLHGGARTGTRSDTRLRRFHLLRDRADKVLSVSSKRQVERMNQQPERL